MVESAREVFGSVRMGERNQRRLLGRRCCQLAIKKAKERCMEAYREENRKVYISEQKRVNYQF